MLVDLTCLTSCTSAPVIRVDGTHFRSQPKIGSGLFSMTIVLDTELVDLDLERHVSARTHGQTPGMTVDATAQVDLRDGENDAWTAVEWTCDLELAGTFAATGARIIAERAPQAIRQIVECLRRQMEAGSAPA